MKGNYIQQLRGLLQAAGLTQRELAQRLGVTTAALSRWLHGHSAPHPKRRLAIAALYKRLVGCKPLTSLERAQLLTRAGKLRRVRLWEAIRKNSDLLDELLLEHTYNSNAIEGSTLTKRETEAVIFDKSHLPNKSLIEHLEAVNHAAVLRDILLKKYPSAVTEDLICRLHKSLLQGIRSDAGQYASKDIPEEMRGLLASWKRADRRGITVVDAAQFHATFELIHPFGDGNGRVGRLVLLTQLLAVDYLPVVVENSRKAEYYEVLEYAQRKSVDPFVAFLVDEMQQTLNALKKWLR